MSLPCQSGRHYQHASAAGRVQLQPPPFDVFRMGSRRWFLQTGIAGLAGISLPQLLRCRAEGGGRPFRGAKGDNKAVILVWLSGGPSHLDTWDPKPDAPSEVRGPFRSIATKVPGLRISEHLPFQASIMDRFAVIR